MKSADKIKNAVREKYRTIAEQSKQSRNCARREITCVGDDYTQVEGHFSEADLNLGCGIPTEVARIKRGDTVLDLGSGAGNDAFIARKIVGEAGHVIGVDMTQAMVEKGRVNAAKLGFTNVEFRLGDIESLPVEGDSITMVLSNCVLNLVPDKRQAFSEIWRVLKPGGHFSISDVVIEGRLPRTIRELAEQYVGCVAGAMPKDEYLAIIAKQGFINVTIAKQKNIPIPDAVLHDAVCDSELLQFHKSNDRIVSITVYGEKPLKDD